MAYNDSNQYSIIEWVFKHHLDPDHELVRLAKRIDWDALTKRLSRHYSRRGRRAKAVRLMVGLHLLKHLHDLSDEDVTGGLHENIYWMHFCGVPVERFGTAGCERWLDASTMTRFRERMGASGMQEVERIVREQLIAAGHIRPAICIADTTCMEKNIIYPTDAGLLNRGRMQVATIIKKLKANGVPVREKIRSYARLGKKAVILAAKIGKNKMERVAKSVKSLIRYAEDTTKHVPAVVRRSNTHCRKAAANVRTQVSRLVGELKMSTSRLRQVIRQSKARLSGVHVSDKLYSLHEPDVTCIRKGKSKTPNEYGCKVGLAVDKNYYVVGHTEYPDNRPDSITLPDVLRQWRKAFDRPPNGIAADRGYHQPEDEVSEQIAAIRQVSIPRKGKTKGPNEKKPWFRRMQRLRAGIEAVISHLKQDHRMNRSRYRGIAGDRINASLAVVAWNIRKWAMETG
jgi:IS5 family transposase